jgi:hypothetical protein
MKDQQSFGTSLCCTVSGTLLTVEANGFGGFTGLAGCESQQTGKAP